MRRTQRCVTPDHDITGVWPNVSPVFLGAFATFIGCMLGDCASTQDYTIVETVTCKDIARDSGE